MANLTPPSFSKSNIISFAIPKISLNFRTEFTDDSVSVHRAKLHTVIIEPDYPRLSVVWHTTLPCHRKVNMLDVTTITEKKVEKPVVQPEQAKPVTQAEPADTSPKSVSIGGSGVQWSRSPKPVYSNQDLQGENRRVVVLIEANEKGSIVNARITRSSGVPALDEKILRAVKGAKFKPYKENGVAYPIRAEQPFDLELNTKR